MILIFRKYIVRILLYISFAVLAAAGFWLFLSEGRFTGTWSGEQIWWTLYSTETGPGLLKALSLCGQLFFAFVMGMIISRQIKRNPSAELSFFYLFLFSFSLQLFRLPYLAEGAGYLTATGGYISRIIYFSRILGLGSLFAASLFSSGLQIQKFGMVFLLVLLTSFTLASILPLNISSVSGSLLNRVAREEYLALFCTAMEVLTVLTYIATARNQGRAEYYRLAFLNLLIIAGYEFLFFLYVPLMIPGFICLVPGTVIYIRTSRKLFLWS
ncbi:MAG: hypothetical protein PQJ50_12940 [Spirochaetales bacterium]|nr:hypothetical protein [Spirochaetales bacterium]